MSDKRKPGKLHMKRWCRRSVSRLAAGLAACCLLVTLLLPGLTVPVRAAQPSSNPTTMTELRTLVLTNLNTSSVDNSADGAIKKQQAIEKLTDAKFKELLKDQKKSKQKWSEVSIPKTIEAMGDEVGLKWDAAMGQGYDGSAMSGTYTIGKFVVDYLQQSEPATLSLSEEQVIKIFDEAAPKDGDMEVTFASLANTVRLAAGQEEEFGYEAVKTTPAIDKNKMVTYRQYTVKMRQAIPNGTLFIGTYLIHSSVLNDVNYQLAMNSMSRTNQQIMYYKSELDRGRWKDVMSPTGLADIMEVGTTVENRDLMKYVITCVIGADGIARNPKDNAIVNLFELSNPYEMEEIPELLPLYMQYNRAGNGVNTGKGQADSYARDMLWQFFHFDDAYDRTKLSKDHIKWVIDLPNKYNMAYANLLPDGRTPNSRQAEFFDDTVMYWGFCAKWYTDRYKNSRYMNMMTPDVRISDWSFHGSYWSIAHNFGFPIIDGRVRWQGEIRFENDYPGSPHSSIWSWRRKSISGRWPEVVTHIHRTMEWATHIFSVHDDVTDAADQKLATLDPLYRRLCGQNAMEDAKTLLILMNKVDATRRAEVYNNLVFNAKNNYYVGPSLLYLLSALVNGETPIGNHFRTWYGNAEFASDSATTAMVEEAIPQCQTRYYEYRGASLKEGTTVISSKEYELSNAVIGLGQNAPDATLVASLRQLRDVYNVQEDQIEDKRREIALCDELEAKADNLFSTNLHNTAGETYRTAAADPTATGAALKEYLLQQKAEVSGYASEMQTLIRAKALRLNSTDGEGFINRRIDWAEGQRAGIKTSDPFGTYATEALNEHIQWLRDLLAKAINGTIAGNEEPEEEETLMVKKQGEYLDALDNGNSTKAAALAKEIEGLAAQEGTTPDGAGGAADDGNGPTPEGEDGRTREKDKTIDKIFGDILEELDDDDIEMATAHIGTLGDLGAKDKLREVKVAAKARHAPASVTQAIDSAEKTAQKNNKKDENLAIAQAAAAGAGGSTGGGTGTNSATGNTGSTGAAGGSNNSTGGNTGGGRSGTGTNGNNGAGTNGANGNNTDGRNRTGTDTNTGSGTNGNNGTGTNTGTSNNNNNNNNNGNDNNNRRRRRNTGSGNSDSGSGSGTGTGSGKNGKGSGNGSGSGSGSGKNGKGSGNTGNGNGNNGNGNAGNGNGNAGNGNGNVSGNGNKGNGNTGNGNGTGTDNGAGTGDGIPAGSGLSDDQLAQMARLIESQFGSAFGGLPEDEKIAVIVGCTRFGEATNNAAVLQYARSLLSEVTNEGNPFPYHQYLSEGASAEKYVSMAAIDKARRYTMYRYVRKGSQASMTQIVVGSKSYVFSIGTDKVAFVDGHTEDLSANVVQQTDRYIRDSDTKKYPYLAEEDSQKYLEISCEYVPDTQWAVVVTNAINDRATMFMDLLAETFTVP